MPVIRTSSVARFRRSAVALAAVVVLAGCTASTGAISDPQSPTPTPSGSAPQGTVSDAHFHISNYAMQGVPLKTFINDYMGDVVDRSVVYGLPLQQKWDPYEGYAGGQMPPNYYIGSDAPMYFYSAIDPMVAVDYAGLSPEEKDRVDPMIVGFNPMDGYGVQHVQRMLLMYPDTFVGVGEFSVHKEIVEDKISDNVPTRSDGTLPADARPSSPNTLDSPALDELFGFAAEAGLVVSLHSDIYPAVVKPDGTVIEVSPDKPYTAEMVELCERNPETTVIWAHTGLGRNVKPAADHLEQVKRHGFDAASF